MSGFWTSKPGGSGRVVCADVGATGATAPAAPIAPAVCTISLRLLISLSVLMDNLQQASLKRPIFFQLLWRLSRVLVSYLSLREFPRVASWPCCRRREYAESPRAYLTAVAP